MPSKPFSSTTITRTRTEETDRTDPVITTKHIEQIPTETTTTKNITVTPGKSTTTKDTGLAVPAGTPGIVAPGITAAGTAAPAITVAPAVGGGVVVAASTAAPGAGALEERDVTEAEATTTTETDKTEPSRTVTEETDRVGEGKTTKVTVTETTVTVTPASTNQFEHASWQVPANGQATILSLQPAGFSALYVAIYRVINDDDSGPVTVQTDAGPIALAPGTAVDVSTQTIKIVGLSEPAHGSYQNLCCSAQSLKTVETKSPPVAARNSIR